MEKDEEILEKLRRFLEEKNNLDVQSCYFLTKRLNESYWDAIIEGDDEEVLDDSPDEFGEFEKGDEDIEDVDVEEDIPDEVPALKEKGSDQKLKNVSFKRPMVKLKQLGK